MKLFLLQREFDWVQSQRIAAETEWDYSVTAWRQIAGIEFC